MSRTSLLDGQSQFGSPRYRRAIVTASLMTMKGPHRLVTYNVGYY